MNKKYFYSTAIVVFLASTMLFVLNLKNNNNKNIDLEEEGNGPSGAMQSLQFMSEIRAYPDKDIPADKFYKAFEYSQESLSNTFDNTFAQQWTSIGPNNIGGRSLAI